MSFSFGCLLVGEYLSGSERVFHNCSLFRAHLCWGEVSVAIVVVLYHISEGTLVYALKLYLLVGMLWADDIVSIMWGDV